MNASYISPSSRRLSGAAILLALVLLAAGLPARALAQDLLSPEQAFRVEARMAGPQTLAVTWHIADDHYMYRHAFAVSVAQGGVALGEPDIPAGKTVEDEFLGKVTTYRGDLTFTVPVTPIADGVRSFTLRATGQGCNEPVGICYPPVTRSAEIELAGASGVSAPMSRLADDPGAAGLLSTPGTDQDGSRRFLHPDEAFRFELTPTGHDSLRARFVIQPGYYLYRDKVALASDTPGVSIDRLSLPQGVRKSDEFFGDVVVYYDGLVADAAVQRDSDQARTVALTLRYQGCAEDGICYPPTRKSVSLELPGIGDAVASGSAAGPPDGTPASGQSAYWVMLLALGSGMLLTFTPCVLPMVPILAGIIVGQGGRVTRLRGGILASVYVLGTAVTYTAMGVVAGLTGEQLQAWFQNIWAIGFVAVLLGLMALSMFGFYELQIPAGLQTRMQQRAAGQRAGAFGGVFVMGMLSALIVGACVSPILISILGLAINRGDPVLGGAVMFAMALGMGVFLIAMGFGFGYLLPRAGPWMEQVKQVFGYLLLGVAVYILGAVAAVPVLYLWAALLLAAAIHLGVHGGGSATRGGRFLCQIAAAALVAWGMLALLGGMQGGRDVLRPLDYQALTGASPAQGGAHAQFRRVRDRQQLARLMKAAAERRQPVMVDYYADWCVDCLRMENTTFRDPRVASVLNQAFTLIQVDVTDPNDPGTRAIKQEHGVFGPPAMLFFDAAGRELPGLRRYGYMDGETFLSHIEPLRGG